MQELFFQFVGVSITTSIFIAILILLSPIINERYRVKLRYYIWLFLAVRLIIPIDFGITEPPIEIEIPHIGIPYSANETNDRTSLGLSQKTQPGSLQEAQTDLLQEAQSDLSRKVPSERSQDTAFATGNASFGEAAGGPTASVAAASGVLTVSQILTLLYFAGAGISLMTQFILYLSFRQSTRRWYQKVENCCIIETFETMKSNMGIARALNIKVCKKVSSPMIVGLIRPILLLPHDQYDSIKARAYSFYKKRPLVQAVADSYQRGSLVQSDDLPYGKRSQ